MNLYQHSCEITWPWTYCSSPKWRAASTFYLLWQTRLPAVKKVHQLPCFCVSRCHQWLSFTSWVLSNLSLANSNLGEQIKWQSFLWAKQMQGFSKNGINCQCQLTEAKSERSSRRNGKKSWKTDINTMSERKGKLIKRIWLGHTKQS